MADPIELKRGYVDSDGNAHKQVTLKAPCMREEVAAERDAKTAGFDADSAFFEVAFVKHCIVAWDGIAEVSIDHVLSLNRIDAATLRNEITRLENEELAVQTSGNSSGGED